MKQKIMVFTGMAMLAAFGYWFVVHGGEPAPAWAGMLGAASVIVGLVLVLWGVMDPGSWEAEKADDDPTC